MTYNIKKRRTEFKQVGLSNENKAVLRKQKRDYNETVWKGWRETDGQIYPVTSFRLEDLQKKSNEIK